MNPTDESLEAMLQRLQPAPPDQALLARLRAARPTRPMPRPQLRLVWAAPLAAAAAIALGLTFQPGPVKPTPPPPPAAPTTVAVENRSRLMQVQDLGIFQNEDKQAVRLVRTTWIDEIGRSDAPAHERQSYLRQEIVPVVMPTY